MEAMDKPAAAIGYSIAAQLADDRHITLQHFVAQEDDDAAVNAAMDRMVRMIDRLKAIHKIPTLVEEQDRLRGQISLGEADAEKLDVEYQAREKEREAALRDLMGKRNNEHEAGMAEHARSNRQTTYEPRGHRKAQIERLEGDIKNLVQGAVDAATEREVALGNLKANKALRETRIAAIDAEIAALRARWGIGE